MTKPVSMNYETAYWLVRDYGLEAVITEVQSPLLMDNPQSDVEPYTVPDANLKSGNSPEPGFTDREVFVARMALRGDISAHVISILQEDVS